MITHIEIAKVITKGRLLKNISNNVRLENDKPSRDIEQNQYLSF
jgi:hypothetical protein